MQKTQKDDACREKRAEKVQQDSGLSMVTSFLIIFNANLFAGRLKLLETFKNLFMLESTNMFHFKLSSLSIHK